MITIDVAVGSGDWPQESALYSLAERALDALIFQLDEPPPDQSEVSLLFTDDNHVQQLNREWRDKDTPTNVLSFAANEGDGPQTPLLGDVILAFETISREAVEQRKTLDDHLTHMLVHGFLHLIGYDHQTDTEAEAMEGLEVRILETLAIADPYKDS